MANIKLGIIGTNFVSDWLCDAVDGTEGIVNAAVYSRTVEKGSEFAAKHNIKNVFTSLDDFFGSEIDAVYIASPNKYHYCYAERAVEAGKHVLLEKPATLTCDEFKLLLAHAKEKGVAVLEAMRPVHDPALEIIRNNLSTLGKLRYVHLDFCQYSSRYDKFKHGEILNAFNPELGNAAVMDIGVYAIEVCTALFGEPEKILSSSIKLDNGFEGMGCTVFDYGDFKANIVYSKITDSFIPSVIAGENGCISIGKISVMESGVLRLRSGEDKVLFTGNLPDGLTNMIYEVNDFVDAVNGKLSIDNYHAYTAQTLKIIDEIREQNKIEFGGSENEL